MCYRISDMSLCKIKKGHTYTLDEFKKIQSQQLSEVMYKHLKCYPDIEIANLFEYDLFWVQTNISRDKAKETL